MQDQARETRPNGIHPVDACAVILAMALASYVIIRLWTVLCKVALDCVTWALFRARDITLYVAWKFVTLGLLLVTIRQLAHLAVPSLQYLEKFEEFRVFVEVCVTLEDTYTLYALKRFWWLLDVTRYALPSWLNLGELILSAFTRAYDWIRLIRAFSG
jgi:hypothetical protein